MTLYSGPRWPYFMNGSSDQVLFFAPFLAVGSPMRLPRYSRAVVVGASLAGLVACGGGASTGPDPLPSPTPAAGPTPRPAPAPTPDPRIGLAAGPIVRYTIKVRTVDNGERDAVQDAQGRWVVGPGERVDFDSTQKNGNNEICRWETGPQWYLDGVSFPDETSTGLVYRRGSSQPFLLKLTIERRGAFSIQAEIDGVRSNVLEMISR